LPNEPRWLSLETVVDINRVAITGEQHFLRGQGLLAGALARPRNAFAYDEEDMVALAVRLLAGLAMAHAFEQGNKRTAFVAMTEFLMTNGYDLVLHDNTGWADEVISLVEHRATEADFVQAIRPFVITRLSPQGPCLRPALPLPCGYGKRQGTESPLPDHAILVLPVHDGGLGSRSRVFPKPPYRGGFRVSCPP